MSVDHLVRRLPPDQCQPLGVPPAVLSLVAGDLRVDRMRRAVIEHRVSVTLCRTFPGLPLDCGPPRLRNVSPGSNWGRRMRIDFVLKRIGMVLILVWVAATLNFIGPRLTGKDPVKTRLLKQAVVGGYVQQGMDEMAKEYERKFGLDKPLWDQYVTYVADMSRFNFGPSIANYPRTVNEIMSDALPWTIILLGTTTAIAFVLGQFSGRGAGVAARAALSAVPAAAAADALGDAVLPARAGAAVCAGVSGCRCFRRSAGIRRGRCRRMTLGSSSTRSATRHCPRCRSSSPPLGFWALGMRAMMVTLQGEDSMMFAEAKGLKDRTLFLRYAMRNALLPQATALALALGEILSGAVLVEVVFGYPGRRQRALQRDQGLRLLPHPGHRLYHRDLDRPGDAAGRSRLSVARSAHSVREELSMCARRGDTCAETRISASVSSSCLCCCCSASSGRCSSMSKTPNRCRSHRSGRPRWGTRSAPTVRGATCWR